jgi:hypothetical protein
LNSNNAALTRRNWLQTVAPVRLSVTWTA